MTHSSILNLLWTPKIYPSGECKPNNIAGCYVLSTPLLPSVKLSSQDAPYLQWPSRMRICNVTSAASEWAKGGWDFIAKPVPRGLRIAGGTKRSCETAWSQRRSGKEVRIDESILLACTHILASIRTTKMSSCCRQQCCRDLQLNCGLRSWVTKPSAFLRMLLAEDTDYRTDIFGGVWYWDVGGPWQRFIDSTQWVCRCVIYPCVAYSVPDT